MLQAASTVANSLGHLKSKYVKYLESLCTSNGIDIQNLKNLGGQYQQLEIFFGGFPVLVGLKYFKNLRVLRIFGQNINSLKPLAEIAGTLEELWICEGQLKDICGIEYCTRLKKLYLYENEIKNAENLSQLELLEVLHLQDNSIESLLFLEKLQNLIQLNISLNGLKESELSTISNWPKKLQTLDLSKNKFAGFKEAFPLCQCNSLRHISLASSSLPQDKDEWFLGWLAYHFRFVENIDGDDLSEMFTNTFLPKAEASISEALNDLAKLEEDYANQLKHINKMTARVEGKLAKLCDVLEKLRDTLPNKDAKREIVKRVLELGHANLRDSKPTKKKCRQNARFIHRLDKYQLAMQLESSRTSTICNPSDEEKNALTQFCNFNCSLKHSYSVFIQHCILLKHLARLDHDKLCLIEKEDQSKLWTEREIFLLLDHHNRPGFRTNPVKRFKDVDLMRKEAKEKTTLFFAPVFATKTTILRKASTLLTVPPTFGEEEKKTSPEVGIDIIPVEDTVAWKDLVLVAIVALELQYHSHLNISHIRFREMFDESFDLQLNKLKEMNIVIDIKEEKARRVSDAHETTLESMTEDKNSKIRRVRETATVPALLRRCSTFEGFGTCMTIRSPVELSLAYGVTSLFTEASEMQTAVTVLDLSSMKLTKLAGIEAFLNLKFLSLRDNKIGSLKKLLSLTQLKFLDVSHNRIGKLEQLPESVVEVNLSSNHLSNLHFCQTSIGLERLNVSDNLIRSVKGIELCESLSTLIAARNHIKEKQEVDILSQCNRLWFLDISGNPLTSVDGYRSRLTKSLPLLLSLDRQTVSREQQTSCFRGGRGLSIDFIEKCYPDWEHRENLQLCDHHLEIIVFETTLEESLSHVTAIDLSRNQLQEVRQLAVLSNLTTLKLTSNSVRVVYAPSPDFPHVQPFKSLQTLDLCQNGISTAILPRLGLSSLSALKHLILQGNTLSRLDLNFFDLATLEVLDVSGNSIKAIKRHTLVHLKELDLNSNRLKDIEGLSTPNLEKLNITSNRISTCAALTALGHMPNLTTLDCSGNPVVSRRVFSEFVKTQVPHLKILDDSNCEEVSGLPDVRKSSIVPKPTHTPFTIEERKIAQTTEDFLTVPVFELPSRKISYDPGWGLDGQSLYLAPERRSSRKSVVLEPPSYVAPHNRKSSFDFVITGTKVERHRKK